MIDIHVSVCVTVHGRENRRARDRVESALILSAFPRVAREELREHSPEGNTGMSKIRGGRASQGLKHSEETIDHGTLRSGSEGTSVKT